MLYEWNDSAGSRKLQRAGTISEARLRAWEYHPDEANIPFTAGAFRDTVRLWITARPDLQIPEKLMVGEFEQIDP
jgi:hypothetical protein